MTKTFLFLFLSFFTVVMPMNSQNLVLETKTLMHEGKEIIAESGTLNVPENRLSSHSRLIDIAFVRLRSFHDNPAASLVYLAGGPGGSSTWMAEQALEQWVPVLEICDVLLIDQRATGNSKPQLVYRYQGPPPLDFFASENIALDHFNKLATNAIAHFKEQGVDLAGYTSVQSADDINDLRVALGLDKISLFGFSYGTHLALATIRRHGEHIENAILMGVEGPNHTFKLPLNMDYQLERISQMAAKDPSISPHIDNLVELYDKVIEKLEKKPMMVEVEGPSDEKLQIPVGPFGLKAILRFDMGDASDIPVFPKLLHSIYHDDPSILSWFVNKRAAITMGMNAMATMMDGASGATEDRLAQIRLQAEKSRFGNIMNIPFMSSDVISFPDLGDEYRSPLLSDVRTLFISGSMDWNTPPFQAEEVRWGFPDSYHIRVKNAGHEQMLPHPKVQKAMLDFLKGEDVSQVSAEWPDIKFVPIDRYDPEVTHPSVPKPR